MSKQSENKEKQGFQSKCRCCGNCQYFISTKKEKNPRCGIGGFEVVESSWCKSHQFKQELTEENKAMMLAWRKSILLDGYYDFNGAQVFDTPTKEEMQKMIDETEYHFDHETKEGVFVYPDGREIKLPANGFRYKRKIYDRGLAGYYWSSSAYSGTGAWYLYFGSSYASLRSDYRAYGFSVFCVVNQ